MDEIVKIVKIVKTGIDAQFINFCMNIAEIK